MYSIIELQVANDKASHLYYTADTHDKAMSKYHEVLKFAAISTIEYHSCIVLDMRGNVVARECYIHAAEIE